MENLGRYRELCKGALRTLEEGRPRREEHDQRRRERDHEPRHRRPHPASGEVARRAEDGVGDREVRPERTVVPIRVTT